MLKNSRSQFLRSPTALLSTVPRHFVNCSIHAVIFFFFGFVVELLCIVFVGAVGLKA